MKDKVKEVMTDLKDHSASIDGIYTMGVVNGFSEQSFYGKEFQQPDSFQMFLIMEHEGLQHGSPSSKEWSWLGRGLQKSQTNVLVPESPRVMACH